MPLARVDIVTILVVVLALAAIALVVGILTLDRPAGVSLPEFAQPQRHFRVPNPAALSDLEALSIYDRIQDDMVAGYAASGEPAAAEYTTWRRYNRAPYRSSTHGERFVNNYGNPQATGYGEPGAGVMPPGAVLAKDSFTVTARGDVLSGPLFLMEKMAPGFSPPSRDWRYSMIMPDGGLVGMTAGVRADQVDFCIGCHTGAGVAADHLYFVPEPYRMKFLDQAPGAGR
jgi:hypothetical protein